MLTPLDKRKRLQKKRLKWQWAAVLISFFVFFVVLLGPSLVFRLVSGIALDAQGPEWEMWLIIASGGLAAGAVYPTCYLILSKFTDMTGEEIEEMLDSRNR